MLVSSFLSALLYTHQAKCRHPDPVEYCALGNRLSLVLVLKGVVCIDIERSHVHAVKMIGTK